MTDEQIEAKFFKGKPGRKPGAPATPVTVEVNAAAVEQASAAANTLGELAASYGQGRDLINQLLGQAQMADSFAKFSKTVFISKLAFVKENKLYQQLAGAPTEDGLHNKGTWDEFCRMLGWTPQHANEAIDSLRNFGEEALESMSKMGIGYRELRQYRKLPEDQKQALIEVAKTGDKEGFVELAEEIIAKHAKEREALQAQVEDAFAEKKANDHLLEIKNKTIDKLQREVKRFEKLPPDEKLQALQKDVADAMNDARGAVLGRMRQAMLALVNAADDRHAHDVFLAGLVGQVQAELKMLRDEFNLVEVGDKPEWERWAEAQELAKTGTRTKAKN